MEIFVRNEDIKYAVVDKSEFEPYSFLLESYDKIEVKSIEQHDAEVRKQVISELQEWADKKMCWADDLEGTYTGNGYKMCQKKLQKKLSEMKGEKDE